jgi:hypothetical protein
MCYFLQDYKMRSVVNSGHQIIHAVLLLSYVVYLQVEFTKVSRKIVLCPRFNKIIGQPFHQTGDSVTLRHNVRLHAGLSDGGGRDGADAGDPDIGGKRIVPAHDLHEIDHRGGARKGDDIHLPLFKPGFKFRLGPLRGDGSISGCHIHRSAQLCQFRRYDVPCRFRAGKEYPAPRYVFPCERRNNSLGDEGIRHEIHLYAPVFNSARCGGADGADAHPFQFSYVAAQFPDPPEKKSRRC